MANVQEIDHEGDKGKVIDQDIEKNTKVERDSTVTIYVSTGETKPVDMAIALPMPSGVHGAYSIEVYKDGNVAFTQSVSRAETAAGGTINVNISGKKTGKFTIMIRNNETGKSIQYAVYDVDFDKKTAELSGNLNESGLIDITPVTTTTTTKAPETEPSETESNTNSQTDDEDDSSEQQPEQQADNTNSNQQAE